LVHVQLDEGRGNGLLALRVLPCYLVDCLRDELEDEVQVDLVLFVTGSVEEVEQLDYVAMLQAPHYLFFKKR